MFVVAEAKKIDSKDDKVSETNSSVTEDRTPDHVACEYVDVEEIAIGEVKVPNYSAEEHETWSLLMAAQEKLIPGRACDAFIFGLEKVNFPSERIPSLAEVSANIERHSGWSLVRVEGLVRESAFFDLLSRKKFPSTDFIRKRAELEYTPAPDMFHDLFGHTPLLTNEDFTEFFQDFGRIGVNASERFASDHPVHKMLARIYWFTVEFGLTRGHSGEYRAYGSGSTSSPKEIQFCVSDECQKVPFDIDQIAAKDYDIWKLQEEVFVVDTFAELGQGFRSWAKRNGLL